MKHILQPFLTVLCCLGLSFPSSGQCNFNPSTIVTPVLCSGDNNGAINLSVSGGPSPFTFLWSNGNTTEDLSNLSAGTYTVTVSDALGCTMTMSSTVSQPANFTISATAPVLNCVNPSDAFKVTVMSGGIPPYIWLLSNNFNSSSSNTTFFPGPVTAPGSYGITVTNSNGCTTTVVSTATQDIISPIAAAGPDRTLNCLSSIIVLDASGSSTGPQFTYVWTGPAIIGSWQVLNPTVNQPGLYTLKVTNTQNGCTASDQVIVTGDIAPPTITVLAPIGLPCGGGVITMPISGTPGSTFSWTGPNGFSSNIENPTTTVAGDYSVVATNPLTGCTATAVITVFPGPAIPIQNFTVTNLLCTPGVLGSIDMLVDFGTAPHIYSWSNGAATEDLDNLAAGTYSVTVSDATGCDYYATIEVTQAHLNTISFSVSHVTCFGGSNGSINLTAIDGDPPYTYHWEGPMNYLSNVEDPTGLVAGNYRVTVTDNSGCSATGNIDVATPSPIAIPSNGTTITFISCPGGANGAINITPTGGTSPYSYDWNNDGPEDPDNDPQDLTGLSAGTYIVTITDANGCVFTSPGFLLSSPAPLSLSTVVTPIPCGSSNPIGAIDLSVSGGTSGYSYQWSDGSITQDLVNRPAGTYTVTVTDANFCNKTSSATIFLGAFIPQGNFTITPTSCQPGSLDGAITLNTIPPAAQSPYTFFWQGPTGFTSTNQDINNLAAGNYTLTITDATACKFLATIVVDKSVGGFTIDMGTTSSNCDGGTIDITVTGGTAPYFYLWSDGSVSEDLIYSQSGTYTVTVTDVTGCSKTASSTIAIPPPITIASTMTPATCNGVNNGAISLTVLGGVPPYTYTWNNGETTKNLNGISPGIYCITVTDGVGCNQNSCIEVTMQGSLGASVAFTSPSCASGINGSLTVGLINPGTAPYSWLLLGPSSQNGSSQTPGFTISGLLAGTYSLTITNADGCSTTQITAITEPLPLIGAIVELSNNCNSAVISANVTGGGVPYHYSWEGPITIPSTAQSIIAPVNGFYQLYVEDANGCGDFANFTVTLGNGGNCGYINGTVVLDVNKNCIANVNEPGLANWLVRAEGLDTLYGITDASGQYLVGVPTGTYTVAVLAPNNLWMVCPVAVPTSVNMPNDTAFGGDIPVKQFIECPALTVSIGTEQLRRCFSGNYYNVLYCNEGTAIAENAYVDVTLDPFLTYINATIPSQNLGNNIRRFFIGNVGIGDCSTFSIRVSVNCTAVLGQTHCTEAHIYPDTLCNTNLLWSGASLSVRSVCNLDSIRFIVKNVGLGNMNSAADYIVVEDAVMLMMAPLPLLPAGDSVTLAFPANGSTWHVEVDQEDFHPYPQPASLSVEGCTTSSTFSTGFVNQFSLGDPSPAVDIDCTANIGSFDPNDKQGYPIGYGAAHYVRPGTEIEYHIRFQNTGTDTAFTVRILDTLSLWLDPATIKFGASSHPYRYDLSGEGIVHFIFDDIMLPDSNVNEAASHGYVMFTIKPRPDAPLQSVIENTANIYFDFNDPVVTNTTFHTLGENFLSVRTWQPHFPLVQVLAMPNPFSEETLLEVTGLSRQDGLRLQVFDFQGKEIRNMTSQGAVFRLKKGDWPAGMYFFKISQNGKIVGSGKLIAQ